MPHTEYTFALTTGWTLLPPKANHLPASDCLSETLGDLDYVLLAESGEGRCYLGHFLVWQRPDSLTHPLPRYALELDQVRDEGVVWIANLPTLWEFLRLYGQVGFTMARCLPGDHDDGEDDEEDGDATGGDGPYDAETQVVRPFHPRPSGLN